jgi:beta-phosphoglucomutase family hydrolase
MLRLPDRVEACLFDLDGVLTDTASVHDAAWKEMFDAFLRERAQHTGEAFVPFDADADYARYVDGRPRVDGVRTFLASRGIELPLGADDDPPTAHTLHGLGNRKNEALLRAIDRDGVRVYDDAVEFLHAVEAAGLRRVVVSSSANTEQVLRKTGLIDLVEGWIDGIAIETEHLAGKPAPDSFLAGAQCAGVEPAAAAVFEDALAGVEAGRAGTFGFVVGVNRLDAAHASALSEHGADVVVGALTDLLAADGGRRP